MKNVFNKSTDRRISSPGLLNMADKVRKDIRPKHLPDYGGVRKNQLMSEDVTDWITLVFSRPKELTN